MIFCLIGKTDIWADLLSYKLLKRDTASGLEFPFTNKKVSPSIEWKILHDPPNET